LKANTLKKKYRCLICHSKIFSIYNFGKIPLVNSFSKNFFVSNKKFLLNLCVCKSCKVCQLSNTPNEKKIYTNYKHSSSDSIDNLNHLKNLSIFLKKKFEKKKKILEVGCNDGSLLSLLEDKFKYLYGIDPAKNFKKKHQKINNIIYDFFDKNIKKKIVKKFNVYKFDLILGLNVFAHFKDIQNAFIQIHDLLNDNGKFIFEVAYSVDSLFSGKFDTVYHEHVFNHSLFGLEYILKKANLNILSIKKLNTQGGSIRIIAGKNRNNNKKIKNFLSIENKNMKLNQIEFYKKFSLRLKNQIKYINKKINKLILSKEPIILVGAPARGVIFVNSTNLKKYKNFLIVDDSIAKKNCYFPGLKNKISDWKALKNNKNKYKKAILLSWNYKNTMIKKLIQNKFKGDLYLFFPNYKKIII
jgi:D-mycarose 3-C-methyltransferase